LLYAALQQGKRYFVIIIIIIIIIIIMLPINHFVTLVDAPKLEPIQQGKPKAKTGT
jgi:uncharacterized protein YpmB